MENKNKTNKEANIFVTLLVILMTVAVIVAVAGAIAKNVGTEPSETKEREETNAPVLREDKVNNTEDEVTKEPDEKKAEPAITKDVLANDTLPMFSCPTDGTLMKKYSIDVPVFSTTMNDYRTHSGVDIYAEPDYDVLAAADGTVYEVWNDPMMGHCISISHSGGAMTVYKNLGDELPDGIEKGASVHAGDVIATVGDTALEEIAEESHLHFEMTVNGASVDPATYIKFIEEASYTE